MPATSTNMPPRCSPQATRLETAWIRRASGSSDGTIRQRTSQARPIRMRCRSSGTGPAPIQIVRASGHNGASTRRSGTSTSENSVRRTGTRPGGATVKRICSVKG